MAGGGGSLTKVTFWYHRERVWGMGRVEMDFFIAVVQALRTQGGPEHTSACRRTNWSLVQEAVPKEETSVGAQW